MNISNMIKIYEQQLNKQKLNTNNQVENTLSIFNKISSLEKMGGTKKCKH